MANRDNELARMLYPKASDIVDEGMNGWTRTSYAYGTAATDSADGNVQVILEGEAAGIDAAIDVPTSNAIAEGDRVLVSVNGNVPVEAVTAGSGDATRAIASEAQAVADAVNQHFWTDTSGIHVTEVDQETFIANPQGANQLSNSQGILLRDGTDVLASFTPSQVQIGSDGGTHLVQESTSLKFMDGTDEHMAIETSDPVSGLDGMSLSTDLNGAFFGFGDEAGYVSMSHSLTDDATKVEIKAQDGSGNVSAIYLDQGVPTVSGSDLFIEASSSRYQFTGSDNLRVNDSSGNAKAYFVKYDATSDTRTQLEHRGCCIWQNSSGNVHIANGMSDSASTWEYSFESGGLYRRTKSGSSWSSWTRIG